MTTLVWIEHDGKQFHPASLNLIEAAKQFKQPIDAVVFGKNLARIAQELSHLEGISKVINCEGEQFFPFRAEVIAKALFELSPKYDVFLTASTSHGKNVFPRFAALMQQGMVSDVVEIKDNKTFVHPIYAGNALAVSAFSNEKVILSIRTSAFEKTTIQQNPCSVELINLNINDSRTTVIAEAKRDNEKPDLQTARVIVSGGRGFGSAENFKLLEEFAKLTGAAIGATRAAVDAGFVSNEYQVGQTGKIVAPELYIAFGISGAIQHLAGMKDSKTIVAINSDPAAPIFEIASYGLVGDLFKILQEMQTELQNN